MKRMKNLIRGGKSGEMAKNQIVYNNNIYNNNIYLHIYTTLLPLLPDMHAPLHRFHPLTYPIPRVQRGGREKYQVFDFILDSRWSIDPFPPAPQYVVVG